MVGYRLATEAAPVRSYPLLRRWDYRRLKWKRKCDLVLGCGPRRCSCDRLTSGHDVSGQKYPTVIFKMTRPSSRSSFRVGHLLINWRRGDVFFFSGLLALGW